MGEAAAKEPSMEDILSSIRKIISEENPSENDASAASKPASQPPETSEPAAASANPSASQTPSAQEAAPAPQQPEAQAGDSVTLKQLADEARQAQSDPLTAKEKSAEPLPQRESISPEPPAGGSLSDIAASVTASDLPASAAPAADQKGEAGHLETEIGNAAQSGQAAPSLEVEHRPAEMSAGASAEPYQPTKAEEEAFKGALVSPSTDSAVNESFERLKRSAMDDIEAKTEVILRPMLREWLDNNLPSLVERLVREEIERVSRGI